MEPQDGQLLENNSHTFVTAGGVELELQPVNRMALQSLTLASGVLDIFANGGNVQEVFAKMTPEQQIEISNKMLGVLRYCMMYGVKNFPPPEILEELKVLGAAVTPNIARMNWVMGLLQDDAEAGRLVAAIRSLNGS